MTAIHFRERDLSGQLEIVRASTSALEAVTGQSKLCGDDSSAASHVAESLVKAIERQVMMLAGFDAEPTADMPVKGQQLPEADQGRAELLAQVKLPGYQNCVEMFISAVEEMRYPDVPGSLKAAYHFATRLAQGDYP